MNNRSDWSLHPVEMYIGLFFLFFIMMLIIFNQHSTIKQQEQLLIERPIRIEYFPSPYDSSFDEITDDDEQASTTEDYFEDTILEEQNDI
jgi:hypothetical protein